MVNKCEKCGKETRVNTDIFIYVLCEECADDGFFNINLEINKDNVDEVIETMYLEIHYALFCQIGFFKLLYYAIFRKKFLWSILNQHANDWLSGIKINPNVL